MTTDDLKAWLQSEGVTEAFSTDGHIPPAPDRLIVLSLTGGPGEKRERTFDVLSVQVLTRGKQRSPSDAEQLAQAVDDVFMGATRPTIGGTYVATIQRAGGPPTFLAREPNSGRVTMSANYLLEAARSVH